jgi:hypothetical protein
VDSCLIFHFNKFYFHLKFYFLCNIHKNETKVFDIGTSFWDECDAFFVGISKIYICLT